MFLPVVVVAVDFCCPDGLVFRVFREPLNQLDGCIMDESLFSVRLKTFLILFVIVLLASLACAEWITLCSAYSRCCFSPMSVKYSRLLMTFSFQSNSINPFLGLLFL